MKLVNNFHKMMRKLFKDRILNIKAPTGGKELYNYQYVEIMKDFVENHNLFHNLLQNFC